MLTCFVLFKVASFWSRAIVLLCPSQTVCVCCRESVSVKGSLLMFLTVLSVTESLSLLHTVCVYIRKEKKN